MNGRKLITTLCLLLAGCNLIQTPEQPSPVASTITRPPVYPTRTPSPTINVTVSPVITPTNYPNIQEAKSIQEVISSGVFRMGLITNEFWNLETDASYELGESRNYDDWYYEAKPSPNKLYFVIGHAPSIPFLDRLDVYSTNGELQKQIRLSPKWRDYAWVDNENLVFEAAKDGVSELLVYNLATDEQKLIQLPFDDLFKDDPSKFLPAPLWRISLSPNQKWVAYLSNDEKTVFYDLEKNTAIWTSESGILSMWGIPVWSPAENYVAVPSKADHALILLNQDGTTFAAYPANIQDKHNGPIDELIDFPVKEYTWSPDGKYLAINVYNEDRSSLQFVEMPSGKVSNFSLEVDIVQGIFWSTDSHQLLILHVETSGDPPAPRRDDIYIDLVSRSIYKFTNQTLVTEWYGYSDTLTFH